MILLKPITYVSVEGQIDLLLGQIEMNNSLAYHHHKACLDLEVGIDAWEESAQLWNAYSRIAKSLADAVHEIRYDNLNIKTYDAEFTAIKVYGWAESERIKKDMRYEAVCEAYKKKDFSTTKTK